MVAGVAVYHCVIPVKELVVGIVIIDSESPTAVYCYNGVVEISDAAVFVPLADGEDVH